MSGKGLRRLVASPWTPFLVFLGLFGSYYAYRQVRAVELGERTYELRGDLLVRGNPGLREVALTFDDGPYGETTVQILDALMEHGAQATFFVVGRHVEARPELIRRMLTDGHEVGNHTYSHPRLPSLTLVQARQELELCEAAFVAATGSHMNLMRPPGMRYNDDVLRLAQDMGYSTIHWNVVAGDYLPVEPAEIVARVMRQVDNGSVILLHDSPDTALALPTILRRLTEQGYRFVTTTQMLSRLPRPVVLATNAGTVLIAESTEPEVEPAVNAPRRRSLKKRRFVEPTAPKM
ncbi:MAG: polysaccharide deacetylase family protein, partial [Armatimonadetes bacterium]|nr:polysaccharide deacetylase family protein [Armatimonadota bacterium]